eukprot:1273235-Prymnesium_polylepis.1
MNPSRQERAGEPTILAAGRAAKQVQQDGHATHAGINRHRVLVQKPRRLSDPFGQALAVTTKRSAVAYQLERLTRSRAPGQQVDELHPMCVVNTSLHRVATQSKSRRHRIWRQLSVMKDRTETVARRVALLLTVHTQRVAGQGAAPTVHGIWMQRR